MKVMFERRIDSILVQQGFCSKRSVKNFVKNNNILINDVPCENSKQLVDLEKDVICVNSVVLPKIEYTYILMNKPLGYVCSTVSDRSKVVYDLLPLEFQKLNLHCVGRLDKDTEGLLLFTNDGNFSDYLMRSENHIFKTYYVELENSVSVDEQQQYVVQFGNGIFLEGEKKAESFVTLPATLEWISDKSCNITICEGKFHQVRRMFFAMKNEVTFLKRVAIGKLFLDSCVQLGNCVKLTKEDIMNLL